MEYRRGVDVVFALDLSRSMEVTDASDGRSRLETGLSIAQDVARGAGDLRLGAAIGKGRGVLAVPLTYDTRTIEQFLESLSVSAITGWGTNLETLIDASAGAFQDGFPTSREIILFSDGEALSGTFGAAIDRLVSRGIRLSVVGLGTEQGGVVPGSPSVAEAPVSFRRGEPLRNAAERTGGLYLDGNDPDTGSRLMASLRALGRTSGIQGYRQEAKARWRLFVLAALMLWGIARSLGLERRGHG
jgi:Ca-activated chloride channel family protein